MTFFVELKKNQIIYIRIIKCPFEEEGVDGSSMNLVDYI